MPAKDGGWLNAGTQHTCGPRPWCGVLGPHWVLMEAWAGRVSCTWPNYNDRDSCAHAQGEMVVHGCGGRFNSSGAELFLGNAGTAMRPLTAAVVAAGRGK